MDFLVAPTSMWDLLGMGIEPMSPALARGFLTTGPPGKSTPGNLKKKKKKPFFWVTLSLWFLELMGG